jgi:hypothetical protein
MGLARPAWRPARRTRLAYSGMAGRVGREELSEAFCQLMEGNLPDLDVKIQEFRQELFGEIKTN